jgi:ElaB/YqjD/DUF883 family membrane-anchored ribosome-binding protein
MSDTPTNRDPRQAIGEFARTAQSTIGEKVGAAQSAIGERVGVAREHARAYGDGALEQYGQARTYVVERIQDKPVSSVLAVLGVGVVLGVLLGLTAQRARYD